MSRRRKDGNLLAACHLLRSVGGMFDHWTDFRKRLVVVEWTFNEAYENGEKYEINVRIYKDCIDAAERLERAWDETETEEEEKAAL